MCVESGINIIIFICRVCAFVSSFFLFITHSCKCIICNKKFPGDNIVHFEKGINDKRVSFLSRSFIAITLCAIRFLKILKFIFLEKSEASWRSIRQLKRKSRCWRRGRVALSETAVPTSLNRDDYCTRVSNLAPWWCLGLALWDLEWPVIKLTYYPKRILYTHNFWILKFRCI